jgi:hypothetical protein
MVTAAGKREYHLRTLGYGRSCTEYATHYLYFCVRPNSKLAGCEKSATKLE